MKPIKIYCIKLNKFRKFVSTKVSYIFDETLDISIICSKYCYYHKKKYLKKKKVMIY